MQVVKGVLGRLYQYPAYFFCGCTELTEVLGTGIELIPNIPMCRVPWCCSKIFKTANQCALVGAAWTAGADAPGNWKEIYRFLAPSEIGSSQRCVCACLVGYAGTGARGTFLVDRGVPSLPKRLVPVPNYYRSVRQGCT